MRGLVWFKRDLRTLDHPALYHAYQACQTAISAVYIIDTTFWQNHNTAHCQIEFILRGLSHLQSDLAKLGIPLLVHTITASETVPDFLTNYCLQNEITQVFFNLEYEIDEKKRDQAAINLLNKHEITVKTFDDQLILPPTLLMRPKQDHYKVFTAFKRYWLNQFYHTKIRSLPVPYVKFQPLKTTSSFLTALSGIKSVIDSKLWLAGEKAARERLRHFINGPIFSYHTERDFPAKTGTSQLSPYLAQGMISAKECFLAALLANNNEMDSGSPGVLTFLSELIWREFYRHILINVPRVCMNKPYKLSTEKLNWQNDPALFTAWQQGQTGFPLVDAAMRQLNTTGWMHNRLRMLTAMFLSKNLFISWQLGEKYFAEHLIDHDFASNNGGWQWCASTGTDAVPYFRIFNPITQSKRFDPEGAFIRQYVPELKGFDNKAIHEPYRYQPDKARACGYPLPIIDYPASRLRILQAFKELKL